MKVSIIPLIVRKLRKALAIVQDTNTATRNIDAGKFVMWKGELCKALSAITTVDTLSSTNLEACSDGGLNVLNSNDSLFVTGSEAASTVLSRIGSYTIQETGIYVVKLDARNENVGIGFRVNGKSIFSNDIRARHYCTVPLKAGTEVAFYSWGSGSGSVSLTRLY